MEALVTQPVSPVTTAQVSAKRQVAAQLYADVVTNFYTILSFEQVLRMAQPEQAYFWATHQGAELDLLMFKGGQRVGVEFKRADAPRVTTSMRIAMTDLKLDALYVVYPGLHRYKLADRMEAVPLWAMLPA